MAAISKDVYANATTLLTGINRIGDVSTFSTLNIVGNGYSGAITLGLNLYPDSDSPFQSNPISFISQNQSSINASIPQLQWTFQPNPLGQNIPLLASFFYAPAGRNFDMRINSLFLLRDNLAPSVAVSVSSDSHSTITIPYSSIIGVSSIDGVNFYGFVSTVKGLSP